MNGNDLREIASGSVCSYYQIVFQDRNGEIHEIRSAITTRCEGISYLMFRETTANDFILRVMKPPQELIDAINKYEDLKNEEEYAKH